VAWPDIVSFFGSFEIGPPAGGPTDGFSRLEHSAHNEKELLRWSKGQP
jgi:hypothetical protein